VFLLYYVAFLMFSLYSSGYSVLLIPVRSKWCDLRNYRGGGFARYEGKFLSRNGGIVIVCRYIIAV
jgi:hypothetical protein